MEIPSIWRYQRGKENFARASVVCVKCCSKQFLQQPREQNCRHLDFASWEELCEKLKSSRSGQSSGRHEKSASTFDLCAKYLYLIPRTSGSSRSTATLVYACSGDSLASGFIQFKNCDVHVSIFPRKCFSLPRCYKPRHHFASTRNTFDGGLRLKCERSSEHLPRILDKSFRSAFGEFLDLRATTAPVQYSASSRSMSPTEFKMKMDIMKKWFGEFSDQQKNCLLKEFLGQCSASQHHLLSVTMAPVLHQFCPENCEDVVSWLPYSIAIYIFSFLDPVSLSQCALVCRAWYDFSSDPQLWQQFCRKPQWQLSRSSKQKEMITFRISDGSIDWKRAFGERYRLRKNWLRGNCHVRTFHGHNQGVSCVQFDDTRIVSGSSDKTIKVWNIRTNSPWSVMTLVGHSGTVRCLHLEGNRLVSGSTDKSIKVWDLSTQHSWSSIACKVTMVGHTETVRCLQVDDDKVVSGSYDCTLKVWDIKTGRCRMTLRGHEGAVLCLQFDGIKIVSGSGDKTIKMWKLSDGSHTMTLSGHEDSVTCLQFDTTKIISGSLDRTIKFWSLSTGACISTLDWMKSEGHTGVVRCLQADRWRIVSAGDDKTLKVWSLDSGQRLVTLRNHSDGVTCLQFNDSIIVSGSYDQTVKLWDFSVC